MGVRTLNSSWFHLENGSFSLEEMPLDLPRPGSASEEESTLSPQMNPKLPTLLGPQGCVSVQMRSKDTFSNPCLGLELGGDLSFPSALGLGEVGAFFPSFIIPFPPSRAPGLRLSNSLPGGLGMRASIEFLSCIMP